VLNAQRGASNVVFLTLLGGGAFGNHDVWIYDAIRRALGLMTTVDLDVRLVSYRAPSRDIVAIAEGSRRRLSLFAIPPRAGVFCMVPARNPPGPDRRHGGAGLAGPVRPLFPADPRLGPVGHAVAWRPWRVGPSKLPWSAPASSARLRVQRQARRAGGSSGTLFRLRGISPRCLRTWRVAGTR
jgi:hypothetical protein